MNELQQIEFNLLKQFIEFCNKHNLKYFLVEGTALGAIRHQGFIPWDDDVDVAMPRKDYDKFIELGKKEFVGDVFLQTWETDPNYPYNFSKLRNSNTTFIEKTYKYNRMNHGVWIDIFPLDGVSKKQGKVTTGMKWHVARIWPHMWFAFPHCFTRRPRKWWWPLDLLIDAFMYPNYIWNIHNHQLKRIEKIMRKNAYDESYYVANFQSAWVSREIMPRELYGNGTKAKFEGLDVIVPEHYDKYLTHVYGDYMKLPPVEKQVNRHITAGMDLTKSYKDYKNDYKKW